MATAVLLLDDGELDDIQEILEDLGVAYGRVRGRAIAASMPAPSHVLISTPRRIESIDETPAGESDQDLVRVVVVDEDSVSLRDHLRDIGFDYLVRRPVHPEALKLLLMHCLYRGEERRQEPRVAVGLQVSFRSGVLPRQATLVDLSTRGCRLLSSYALEPGKKIRIQIPESLGATEVVSLQGRVLRVNVNEGPGGDGLYRAAVKFEDVTSDDRNELEWIIEDKVAGPPTLLAADGQPAAWLDTGSDSIADSASERKPAGAPAQKRRRAFRETVSPNLRPDPRSEGVARIDPPESAVPETEPPTGGAERRAHNRRPYGARVPAFGDRALRVLIGRDLSIGGMRIASHPDLKKGDRLHLAIYGSPGQDPFLIWGTLARDDGDHGMAFEFDEIHPTVAEKLESLLASLPSVESLQEGEIAAMGSVLSEILRD